MKSFGGRVAVVTGGASGIGRAMADRFAGEGCRIVLADIEQDALDRAASDMQSAGAEVLAVRTDVSDGAQVQALARRTIDTFGAVHIVCNNAGVTSQGAPAWEQSEADWRWVLDVNLWGVIHGIRAFVPIMLEQGGEGHIVNTGSLAGLLAFPNVAPYIASKFAVVAISESLHFDLAALKSQIGVSVLCPGLVQTNIIDSARNRPADLPEGPPGPIRAELLSKHDAGFRQRMTSTGLPPPTVADRVFEAVRDNRFYILTHPEYNAMIEQRCARITEGANSQQQ